MNLLSNWNACKNINCDYIEKTICDLGDFVLFIGNVEIVFDTSYNEILYTLTKRLYTFYVFKWDNNWLAIFCSKYLTTLTYLHIIVNDRLIILEGIHLNNRLRDTTRIIFICSLLYKNCSFILKSNFYNRDLMIRWTPCRDSLRIIALC